MIFGAPQIVATTNNRWVKTYLDGLGRTAKVERGDAGGVQSSTEIVYDACGCNPMGKVYQRSVPHAPGATANWVVYTYDALGRRLTAVRPDGHSTTTYSYAGNTATVTDPAGNWKTFTRDAFGQIVQVQEPSPRPGTEPNHVTSYAYDVFGHLIGVTMPRTINGTVRTQTRTWTYDPQTLRLLSKTSPEAGTVTYTYNGDDTLATATDAKNQRAVYSYDQWGRITQISRGTVSGGIFTEDPSQRTTYAYEGINGGYSTATAGRVSQITYAGPHGLSFTEWYSYHKGGVITNKRLHVAGTPFGTAAPNLDAAYTYDNEGNVTSIQYPNAQSNSDNSTVAGPKYTYAYDSMERLNAMTDAANNALVGGVTYNAANQTLQLSASTFTETRTYNANLELIELTSGTSVHYKYNYSGTQDNGQIQSQNDVISGETITYQYDSLLRLVNAGGTGDPSGAWSQAFTYDGFGNLTQKTASNAPALSVAVDYATNRIQTSAAYDANGNMTAYAGDQYAFDLQNRMVQANPASGGTVLYGYDSTNHRIYKGAYNGSTYSAEEIYFYGAEGHKYGTWQLNPSSGVLLKASVTKQWFGNRLLSPQDRLDSRGKYYPYGEERTGVMPPNPPNDQEKFASYTRDSATGLDYADQRYYDNMIGRFIKPDPFGGSANPLNPQSWNRYAYVNNDPANNFDPEGLFISAAPYQDFIAPGVDYVYTGPSSSGGGVSINSSAPTFTEPAPYDFLNALQQDVKLGLMTDCNALGGYASYVQTYYGFANQDAIVAAFGNLTPPSPPAGSIPGIVTNPSAIPLNTGQPSGFLSQFQNNPPDPTLNKTNGDQGHHFAAFFQLGYKYGATFSTIGGVSFEVAEAIFHTFHDKNYTPVNTGDVELSYAAAQLGEDYRNHRFPVGDLANQIIDRLCTPPPYGR